MAREASTAKCMMTQVRWDRVLQVSASPDNDELWSTWSKSIAFVPDLHNRS
jgi:hypothetical protein